MSTPANYYVDVVFEAVPNRAAFAGAMHSVGWAPWLSPADVADPEDDRAVGFDPVRIVSTWAGDVCYMRVTSREWADLQVLGMPLHLTVVSQLDPFAELTFADPDKPTERELNRNNVWYWISRVVLKVEAVRRGHPREVDGVKRGLRFGAFDERQDFKGAKE